MNAKRFQRGAGILLSVTSLPSAYGIGTVGNEAFRFVDLLMELKQRYWQVLPLGPTSFGDSPYQSFSAFAGNPYLIDLEELMQEGLLKEEDVKSYNWGSSDSEIDYSILFESRFQVLQKAHACFDESESGYRKFTEMQKDWLDDYSFFMAMKTFSDNKPWYEWEEDVRNRKESAMQEYRSILRQQISFWKFCQYKFFVQWTKLKKYANDKGVMIIGDIPLYVAYDSADVWANREEFQLDKNGMPTAVAGCPPDYFSEDGQKWGNPLYRWDYMEKNNFRWWRKRMKANAALYDAIRIDHFIGMVKYYSIPAKCATARIGKWVKGPGRKLMEAIDEAIGECRIIAENLGASIPAVNKLLAKAGWPGMQVLLFGFDGNTDNPFLPHNYESSNTVVYTGTHDNDTVVGFYRDKTEYELAFLYAYLNISSKEEIPDAMIRLAYSSTADVVILQMQDVMKLGNEARMNIPSTLGENWKWRVGSAGLDEKRRIWIRTMAAIYRR